MKKRKVLRRKRAPTHRASQEAPTQHRYPWELSSQDLQLSLSIYLHQTQRTKRQNNHLSKRSLWLKAIGLSLEEVEASTPGTRVKRDSIRGREEEEDFATQDLASIRRAEENGSTVIRAFRVHVALPLLRLPH
jgi:hypothetical protein